MKFVGLKDLSVANLPLLKWRTLLDWSWTPSRSYRGRLAGPAQRVGGIGPVQAGVINPDKPVEFLVGPGFAPDVASPVAFGGDPKPFDADNPNLFVRQLIEWLMHEKGVAPGAQGPRQAFGNRAVTRKGVPGSVTPEDAKAAILGQLQARKADKGAVRRERQIANLLNALDEAEGNLIANAQPGPAGLAPGQSERQGRVEFGGIDAPNVGYIQDVNVSALGQIKGDKLMPDMGLKLGNQRATVENAIRIQNADGSYTFVDRAGNDLSTPIKEAQSVNMAEALNAPDGANNAYDFVEKNQFENRNANLFGDEDLIASLNQTASGGGIEQVDIGGAMRDIEQRVAKRLGQPPKRINSIKGFQAAMNAVIEDQAKRGNAFINIVDGQKVAVENPGVEEALVALKVQPREAKQIANALKQQELAEFSRFDPRVPVDSAVRPGPNPANVFFGLDNPANGGNRLQLAKDVKFQTGVLGSVDGMSTADKGKFLKDINLSGGRDPDAAKPFIGLQSTDRRAVGDTKVYQGMNPSEVREFMEQRQRQNREGNVAKAAKAAKKKGKRVVDLGPGINEQRRNVEAIRKMQEGNIFAQVRADRAAAKKANEPVNVMGSMVTPTQQPVPGDFVAPRGGYKKVTPGLKRKGDAKLLNHALFVHLL